MMTAAPTRPALPTGWEPDAPVDDTVLRHGLAAMAASWEVIAETCGGRVDHDGDVAAVDLGRPTGVFNSATLLRPVRDDAFGVTVDRIERFYDTQGTGAALLWSPWPTPDLTGRGWTLQGHPPLLYRPAGLPVERRRPTDLELAEVTTPDALAEWCGIAVEAFPFAEVDAPRALLDPEILDDPRSRFVIGRVGGRGVAIGCHLVVEGTNVLLLSTTRPEGRGQGYYAALVADRLAREPDLPAATIVSDDSRPILVSRFGFLPISRFTLWERPRH